MNRGQINIFYLLAGVTLIWVVISLMIGKIYVGLWVDSRHMPSFYWSLILGWGFVAVSLAAVGYGKWDD